MLFEPALVFFCTSGFPLARITHSHPLRRISQFDYHVVTMHIVATMAITPTFCRPPTVCAEFRDNKAENHRANIHFANP